MIHKETDRDYYLLCIRRERKYPDLAWRGGQFQKPYNSANLPSEFRGSRPIDTSKYHTPYNAWYDDRFIKEPVAADVFFMRGGAYVVGDRVKEVVESMEATGVQFLETRVRTDKGEILEGYQVMHVWNTIAALDEDNFTGGRSLYNPEILVLRQFSLDDKVLRKIPLKDRLIFHLAESHDHIMVHERLKQKLEWISPTGISFVRLDKWEDYRD